MRLFKTNRFEKQYRKLDISVRNRVNGVLRVLAVDDFKKRLKIKRMVNVEAYEVRIDYRYRLTFGILGDEILLYTVGMHDEGLGKK